jgi:hypothetical protein
MTAGVHGQIQNSQQLRDAEGKGDLIYVTTSKTFLPSY